MSKKTYALPILNTFVPQVGQTPWVAGLPFFMVILLASGGSPLGESLLVITRDALESNSGRLFGVVNTSGGPAGQEGGAGE
jgi:hypothetical protein